MNGIRKRNNSTVIASRAGHPLHHRIIFNSATSSRMQSTFRPFKCMAQKRMNVSFPFCMRNCNSTIIIICKNSILSRFFDNLSDTRMRNIAEHNIAEQNIACQWRVLPTPELWTSCKVFSLFLIADFQTR